MDDLVSSHASNQDGSSLPQGAQTFERSQGVEKPTAESNNESFLIAPRKFSKRLVITDDKEPLVDTTAPLKLHSKKTERLQKKRSKKTEKNTVHSETKSFLELPPELLQEVLSHLQPSDILRLTRLSRATAAFIQRNEPAIASAVIRRRYWVLSRAFPLPVPLARIDGGARAALLSAAWQERIVIHQAPYQHVGRLDAARVCTCTTCVLAWNNLCLALDLAHFQRHLREREPLPMIARGALQSPPPWHAALVRRHARVVEQAALPPARPLVYAAILEVHLATVVGTLTRLVRVGKRAFRPRPLYGLSDRDVACGTDEFLERHGEPSYEFPYHRDKYYYLEAYVPNRKWSEELARWQYASPATMHESDLARIVAHF